MSGQGSTLKHVVLGTVPSTQAWAHANPDQWNPLGWTAISAVSQSQGQGSGGTTWTDVPGSSLLMTLVSPELQWSSAFVFVRHAQASLVIVEWLQSLGFKAQLKWPNDLYLHGLKLGGFFTEAYWQQNRCTRWFLGLGLNVSAAPDGCAFLAGLSLDGLVEQTAEMLSKALEAPLPPDVLDRYTSNLMGWQVLGTFRDKASGELLQATPRLLSPDGRLGLELLSGGLRWVGHKELEWSISPDPIKNF